MQLGLDSPEKSSNRRLHRATRPQLLTRDALDGRTNAAKTFDRIRAGIRADLGGDDAKAAGDRIADDREYDRHGAGRL